MKVAAVNEPVNTPKRSRPSADIAEIMFTLWRAPVALTTGVRPTAPQVLSGCPEPDLHLSYPHQQERPAPSALEADQQGNPNALVFLCAGAPQNTDHHSILALGTSAHRHDRDAGGSAPSRIDCGE
jgi:hypothetical protein